MGGVASTKPLLLVAAVCFEEPSEVLWSVPVEMAGLIGGLFLEILEAMLCMPEAEEEFSPLE